MPTSLFTQNTIALIWDFDKTLIPEYMQTPLFRRFGVDEPLFWQETNRLAEHYRQRGYHLSPEIAYLNHLLTYVRSGHMAGLNNRILAECGREIQFYPGLPSFLDAARGFESRNFDDVIGVDQPIPSRHWRAVVQERGVAHHSRHAVGAAYHDGEVALWTSPE